MRRTHYVSPATIRSGKLVIRNLAHWMEAMRSFRDGPVFVSVQEARKVTRSAEANRWYWSQLVRPLSDYCGYSPLELHQYLKDRFLPHTAFVIANADGEIVDERVVTGATTTTLSPAEFSAFCEQAAAFAAELGVEVGSHD